MGKQYSFKVTRRTEYLEQVIESIPEKDRSEAIRQALTLGFESMGILAPQKSLISPTFVPKTSEVSTTNVEQSQGKGDTKVRPSPSVPLPEPEFTILEEKPNLLDLENALDNMKF